MGQRAAARAGRSDRPERSPRQIAHDALGLAGCRAVELVLSGQDPHEPPRRAALAAHGAEAALAAVLPAAGLTLAQALARVRARLAPRVAPCEPAVAAALGAAPGLPYAVLVPVRADGRVLGAFRFVCDGRPDRARLRAFEAVARGAAARLDADRLRREASRHAAAARREAGTLEQLRKAKETVTALNLAGTHLMVETDEAAIFAVICRELVRLGFHSAILAAERTPAGPAPPFRFAASSFSPSLRLATERLLGRPVAEMRLDPAGAPLVRRAIESPRAVHTSRAREAARQIFGADDRQLRRLERMLGLRHVVVAALRYDQGVAGLLVVAAKRLRRSDPDAIDAFALQASIALEKARLFGELRAHQARLASEVERRTRELTLAVRALEELDRRKDNFLANVSHELRTPLVTVLGYTDLVLAEKIGALAPKQRECPAWPRRARGGCGASSTSSSTSRATSSPRTRWR
jgi:hypothetical protein